MFALMFRPIQNTTVTFPMSMALVLFVIAPVGVALIAKAYELRPAVTRRVLCAVLVAMAIATAINQTVSAFYIQCYWFMVECWF